MFDDILRAGTAPNTNGPFSKLRSKFGSGVSQGERPKTRTGEAIAELNAAIKMDRMSNDLDDAYYPDEILAFDEAVDKWDMSRSKDHGLQGGDVRAKSAVSGPRKAQNDISGANSHNASSIYTKNGPNIVLNSGKNRQYVSSASAARENHVAASKLYGAAANSKSYESKVNESVQGRPVSSKLGTERGNSAASQYSGIQPQRNMRGSSPSNRVQRLVEKSPYLSAYGKTDAYKRKSDNGLSHLQDEIGLGHPPRSANGQRPAAFKELNESISGKSGSAKPNFSTISPAVNNYLDVDTNSPNSNAFVPLIASAVRKSENANVRTSPVQLTGRNSDTGSKKGDESDLEYIKDDLEDSANWGVAVDKAMAAQYNSLKAGKSSSFNSIHTTKLNSQPTSELPERPKSRKLYLTNPGADGATSVSADQEEVAAKILAEDLTTVGSSQKLRKLKSATGRMVNDSSRTLGLEDQIAETNAQLGEVDISRSPWGKLTANDMLIIKTGVVNESSTIESAIATPERPSTSSKGHRIGQDDIHSGKSADNNDKSEVKEPRRIQSANSTTRKAKSDDAYGRVGEFYLHNINSSLGLSKEKKVSRPVSLDSDDDQAADELLCVDYEDRDDEVEELIEFENASGENSGTPSGNVSSAVSSPSPRLLAYQAPNSNPVYINAASSPSSILNRPPSRQKIAAQFLFDEDKNAKKEDESSCYVPSAVRSSGNVLSSSKNNVLRSSTAAAPTAAAASNTGPARSGTSNSRRVMTAPDEFVIPSYVHQYGRKGDFVDDFDDDYQPFKIEVTYSDQANYNELYGSSGAQMSNKKWVNATTSDSYKRDVTEDEDDDRGYNSGKHSSSAKGVLARSFSGPSNNLSGVQNSTTSLGTTRSSSAKNQPSHLLHSPGVVKSSNSTVRQARVASGNSTTPRGSSGKLTSEKSRQREGKTAWVAAATVTRSGSAGGVRSSNTNPLTRFGNTSPSNYSGGLPAYLGDDDDADDVAILSEDPSDGVLLPMSSTGINQSMASIALETSLEEDFLSLFAPGYGT